jgi:hypothetical protein
MDFTIGSDPEFILIDDKNNFKSAIGIIKGSRKKRLKINNLEFYYDNVLAEFTVKPADNKSEFILNVHNSIKICKELIKPYNISQASSAYFSNEELIHPDARKAGCDVEYCAYSLDVISSKKINKLFRKSRLRTAGGHVHLGTDLGKNHESCVMLVRMLDLFLGFTFLFLDNSKESIERRKIYGSPGRYRQPKYGLEYRTLSNFWLSSPKLVGLIYDICEFVLNFTQEKKYEYFWKIDQEKLSSDDFWNNDGDPAKCHHCYGYDINNLFSLFSLNKTDLEKHCLEIKEIVDFYMPDNIKNQINDLIGQEFEIEKEWAIF